VAASSATRTGSWSGSRRTKVPIRIRVVRAAIAAAMGSREGEVEVGGMEVVPRHAREGEVPEREHETELHRVLRVRPAT